MDPLITTHREAILQLAAKYHIQNLRLFGSRARGEARPDSDIDFLADLSATRFFDMVAFCEDVEALLHHKVDMVSEGALSQRMGPFILKDASPL